MQDLLSGAITHWRGGRNYVELDPDIQRRMSFPGAPLIIARISQPLGGRPLDSAAVRRSRPRQMVSGELGDDLSLC